MRLKLSSLFEQGVLQKSESGAAGVVPVVVQTAGLTFEQQKVLLAMQFEQEKLRLEKLRLEQEKLELRLEKLEKLRLEQEKLRLEQEEVGAGEVGVEVTAAGGSGRLFL
ncbi:hypothetical protein NQZ68_003160 [Dissostichus eleginoides]|nr:hypothetical protein NQZ68_003160 [Dissostichus eleginoides]